MMRSIGKKSLEQIGASLVAFKKRVMEKRENEGIIDDTPVVFSYPQYHNEV